MLDLAIENGRNSSEAQYFKKVAVAQAEHINHLTCLLNQIRAKSASHSINGTVTAATATQQKVN